MNKKEYFKKNKEELQDYLMFRRRGTRNFPKKGKGSVYSRKKKHKNKEDTSIV